MKQARFSRAIGVVALLAVLLSYSFDFECLLEREACQQQLFSLGTDVDSGCSQPTLLPIVVAILPPSTLLSVPAPVVAQESPTLWNALPAPVLAPQLVPLGLRAPPPLS